MAAQQSKALYDTPVVLLDADSAPFQRLLDFNGDGYQDIVGHRVRDDGGLVQVMAWLNDGHGSFTKIFDTDRVPPMSTPDWRSMSIAVGDWNGDGLDDFVLGGGYGRITYTAKVSGGFSVWNRDETYQVISVAAADFDGDGKDDEVLYLQTPVGEARVKIYFASGTVLEQALAIPPMGYEITVLETDGDALPDFMLWAMPTAYLYAIENGAISSGPVFTASAGAMTKFAAGDVDGDHDDDVVAFSMPFISTNPSYYDLFRRGSASGFDQEPVRDGGPAEFLVDLDGDGDLDGVCCGGGGSDPEFPKLDFPSTFEMALNDGTGNFVQAFTFPGMGSRQLAGIADLDADGDRDVVAGRCIYYARGPMAKSPAPGTQAFLMRPFMVQEADRDGDLDFGVSLYNGFFSKGDGSFEARTFTFPDAPPGYTLSGPTFSGDFTSDGAVDWIYSMYKKSTHQFEQMMLIANHGGGGFLDPVPAADPGVEFGNGNSSIDCYLAGDADGDGDVDLFVRTVDDYPAHSKLYLNDGSAYFAFQEVVGGRVEFVGNLDGDPLPDLLLGSPGELTVRRGIGSGGASLFSSTVFTFSGIYAAPVKQWIDVSDYNEDGYRDVAWVDYYDHPVLFLNTTVAHGGVVTFEASDAFRSLTIDAEFACIVGGDANNDGLTDVLITAPMSAPNGADVYLRKAGSSGLLHASDYESPIRQVMPSLIRTELDGDGTPDFVGAYAVRCASYPEAQRGHRRQYGTGTPGTGGVIPTLGAAGPFRVGENAVIHLSGTVGKTFTLLVVGLAESNHADFPWQGITSYADPWLKFWVFPVSGPPGGKGAGKLTLPYVVLPQVGGLALYHQCFVLDPVATFAASNGLELIYGP